MFSLKRTVLASTATLALSIGMIGCQPERPDVVPASAQMLESGNGMMHYLAPSDGTVYVFDHSAQRLLWTGRVFRGDSIEIDTQKGQITSGGMVVSNKLTAPLDQKDIYFDPVPAYVPPTNTNNNSVLVTPNVSVQPSNGSTTDNGVTVQPGVTVTPAKP